jgi:hypothetical protein
MNWGQFVQRTAIAISLMAVVVGEIYLATTLLMIDL